MSLFYQNLWFLLIYFYSYLYIFFKKKTKARIFSPLFSGKKKKKKKKKRERKTLTDPNWKVSKIFSFSWPNLDISWKRNYSTYHSCWEHSSQISKCRNDSSTTTEYTNRFVIWKLVDIKCTQDLRLWSLRLATTSSSKVKVHSLYECINEYRLWVLVEIYYSACIKHNANYNIIIKFHNYNEYPWVYKWSELIPSRSV